LKEIEIGLIKKKTKKNSIKKTEYEVFFNEAVRNLFNYLSPINDCCANSRMEELVGGWLLWRYDKCRISRGCWINFVFHSNV
jgi:hypothetical protein